MVSEERLVLKALMAQLAQMASGVKQAKMVLLDNRVLKEKREMMVSLGQLVKLEQEVLRARQAKMAQLEPLVKLVPEEHKV
jgi:hypothetical protein